MGRPEKSLGARHAALQDLAAGLRRMRTDSGGRSYRQLAKTANFGASTLARAASGLALPSWELTQAYVVACGGDPHHWRELWLAAARSSGHDNDPARPARQLPADLGDFVGRVAECELLMRDAVAVGDTGQGAAPLVFVITGPGGIGKTSLAVHVAHRLADHFPDGQLFADLHGYDEHPAPPSLVASRLAAAIGVSIRPGADPVGSLRTLMAGRRMLVVLDNAASEGQIEPLLPASSSALVIVTSRHALGGLPGAQTVRLPVLGQAEAVDLVTRVAGPTDMAAAASLSELCGRFPLALRIIAARLANSPPGNATRLAARLRDDEERLGHLVVGDLDLSTVFAMSYRGLPDDTRLAFRMAGLFPGEAFSPAGVAALCGLTTVDAERALDTLANASLVQPDGGERYQMHDLLRLYAKRCAQREATPSERIAAMGRLGAWYLAHVDAADRAVVPDRGRPVPDSAIEAPTVVDVLDAQSAIAWYDAERANLVAVTRATARDGQHAIAWRLAAAMRGLLDLRSHLEDWATVHRIGLASARAEGDRDAVSWMLNGLGMGHWRAAAYDEAIECFTEVLALKAADGDPHGVAVVLNNLSNAYGAQGRHDKAIECLTEALTIHDCLDNPLSRSFALHNLGHLQHERGQFAQALPLLEEALRIRRTFGSPHSEAITLHCLGDTLAGLGRAGDSLACLRRSLVTFRRCGNRYGEAVALHSAAGVCAGIGKPEPAVRYLRHAIALYRGLDHDGNGEVAKAERQLAHITNRPQASQAPPVVIAMS